MNRPDFTVANLGELLTLHVADLVEGAYVWVGADAAYWTLEKNSGATPSPVALAPLVGAPTAGAANARWTRGFAPTRVWPVVGTNNPVIDVPAVQNALNSAQGLGQVQLYGIFAIDTPLKVPPNTDLVADSAVVINSTIIPGTVGYLFFCVPTQSVSQVPLQAKITYEDPSFSVSTLTMASGETIAVDGYVAIYDTLHPAIFLLQYRVKKITGAGPFVVTVDRPILYDVPLATGTVGVITQPAINIRMRGNGALIQGSGLRAFELIGGWECTVSDWRIRATAAANGFLIGIGFDIGSYRSRYTDIDIDMGSPTSGASGSLGVIVENAESCLCDRVVVRNGKADTTTAQFFGYQLRKCVFRDCVATGGDVGFMLDNAALVGSPATLFSLDNLLQKCDGSSNGIGFLLMDGSRRWTIDECTGNYNTSAAIFLETTGTGSPIDCDITNFGCNFAVASSGNFVHVAAATLAKRIRFSNCTIVDDCIAGVADVIDTFAACELEFDNLNYSVPSAAGTHFLSIQQAGGTLRFENVLLQRAVGGAIFGIYQDNSVTTATSIVGADVDVSAADIPYASNGAAKWHGTLSPSTAKASFAVDASLVNAAAQYIAAGSRAAASLTQVSGSVLAAADYLQRLDVAFIGNVANVGGQTVAIKIQRSADHGATFADVTGAVTGALATTAGAHSATIEFDPVALAEGDILIAVATPSALLTAVLTSVVVSTK